MSKHYNVYFGLSSSYLFSYLKGVTDTFRAAGLDRLQFYTSGAFQDTVDETIGLDQCTVCRTVKRVTNYFLTCVPYWVSMSQCQGHDVKVYTTLRDPQHF